VQQGQNRSASGKASSCRPSVLENVLKLLEKGDVRKKNYRKEEKSWKGDRQVEIRKGREAFLFPEGSSNCPVRPSMRREMKRTNGKREFAK